MATITEQELISRLQAGARLRWVPRFISGKKGGQGHHRDLFLDRSKLNSDEEELCAALWCEGVLIERESEEPTEQIVHLELADPIPDAKEREEILKRRTDTNGY